MYAIASVLASSFIVSINWAFASSADKLEITSSCSTCRRCILSTSVCFLSKKEMRSSHSFFFCSNSEIKFFDFARSLVAFDSLSRVLFSDSDIFLSLFKITLSCSAFNSKNFSLACSILSFFKVSASTPACLAI